MQSADMNKYESILRELVPGLTESEPLRDDAVLADLGLDSLRAMKLLVVLEREYHVLFSDELLVARTFDTVGSLRAALDTALTGDPL